MIWARLFHERGCERTVNVKALQRRLQRLNIVLADRS